MPQKVREWTLIEEIGRGGMGVIYRASHDLMDGDFALKRVHSAMTLDAEARARFLREVKLSTALRHPNIVRYELPFVDGRDVYLPMELLRGESLEARVRQGERLPWAWVIEILRQAAAGLAHAHAMSRPLVHRDVKPSNLFLCYEEGLDPEVEVQLKILDFGLAKQAGDASLTAAQSFVGTLRYIAPEQFKGEEASPASDIFALGLILYQLLVGAPPFELPSQMHLMMMALSQTYTHGFPASPCEAGVDAPPWLDALTRAMLSIQPARRPQSGLELLLELHDRGAPEESGLDLRAFDEERPQAPQRRGLWARIKEGDAQLLEQARVQAEARIQALSAAKRRLEGELVRLKAEEQRREAARLRAEQAAIKAREALRGASPLTADEGARLKAQLDALQEQLQEAQRRRVEVEARLKVSAEAAEGAATLALENTLLKATANRLRASLEAAQQTSDPHAVTELGAALERERAARQAAEARLTRREEKIARLKVMISAAEAERQIAERRAQDSASELTTLHQQIHALRAAEASATATAAQAEGRVAALEAEQAARREQRRRLSAENAMLKAQLSSAATATPAPKPPITAPTTTEIERANVEVDWVRIEGGAFEMGDPLGPTDERPTRVVHLAPFYASRDLITVGQYAVAVRAGVVAAPEPFGWLLNPHMNWGRGDRERHPINGVSWDQARRFAEWCGGRLLSEAEWEFAARSRGQRRKHAWGSTAPNCNFAVMKTCSTKGTLEIGARARGNTQQGLRDINGNLWEWVEDLYHPDYQGAPTDGSAWLEGEGEARVLRGGGWESDKLHLTTTYRGRAVGNERLSYVGFRIAKPG
ncbi:SUMF1/EgtB/PvdO family nonheme iron enzyme [Myxococcota bacterium]|nr:SUMF1/EgtB/PvdO family nonheme iron enzyme [Myxococcota bacterium]MBU1430374.1 SUMF1/EgtB/PvdO family nonheme iron enzyme [Myxococcota bacterium]MBU1899415.1 SUMF1/EgtB/PvdO family nonheme iron enzyme [Myxococcota bacterium]